MRRFLGAVAVLWVACSAVVAEERTESFDREPAWDGYNHRAVEPAKRQVEQDFGYQTTSRAGGKPGEIGGLISPAGETAYYAVKIDDATFDTPLEASGVLASSNEPYHVLVAFFNSETVNEWRTPNSVAIRLNGRGEVFFGYVEYCTGRWRAGGDYPQSFPAVKNPETERDELTGFPADGRSLPWKLRYDPKANDGHGAVIAVIGEHTAICHLEPDHRRDGARFNRFGIMTVMKSADTGGHLWLDDVTVNGRTWDFATDPEWEGVGNRRTFDSPIVRPRFDFGFSPTQFAGGTQAGELGGLIFRGDCRYPAKMAHYADRIGNLTLEKPLRAKGRIALRRGVSDSGVLLGFFNSRESTRSNPSQRAGLPDTFFGISTDAPSREGFFLSPTYRVGGDSASAATQVKPPYLYPDGTSHEWTFDYDPAAAQGNGEITVTLDGQTVKLALEPGQKSTGATFDRFGLISTWVDGNSQTIYFDDLTYTASQE